MSHCLQPPTAFIWNKTNALAETFGSKKRTSKIAWVLTFLLNCVECSSICQYNYSIKTKELEERDIWTLDVITVCMKRGEELAVVYRTESHLSTGFTAETRYVKPFEDSASDTITIHRSYLSGKKEQDKFIFWYHHLLFAHGLSSADFLFLQCFRWL